jgi:predicted nucleotidyltransferase
VEEIVSAFCQVFKDELVALVLYGSYARGEQKKSSDIDLLIVLKKIDDRYEVFKKFIQVEKILEQSFYKKLKEKGFDPYISPVFLDVENATRFRPLYIDIVFDAKILYDKDNIMKETFERVKKRLEELGAKRIKYGNSHYVIINNFKPGQVIKYE